MDRPARRRLTAFIAAAAVLGACSRPPASVTAPPLAGTYALTEGSAAVDARMDVRRADHSVTVDIVQTKPGASQPVRDYAIEHTQIMHLVVVGEDFRAFAHLHPAFDAKTGHFTQTLSVDPARRYYVYADTQPKGMSPQVFRFALQPSSATASPSNAPAPSFTPSPDKTVAGPYALTFSTTILKATAPSTIDVTIARGGKPATDLAPYLGAAAHAIAINTASLDYVHVHPTLAGEAMPAMSGMAMSDENAEAGPRMTMHLPSLPVGSYKMWLQFRGGGAIYTAPLTLVVR